MTHLDVWHPSIFHLTPTTGPHHDCSFFFPKSKKKMETAKDASALGLKPCPYCGQWSELVSGCNYVTCVCKGGEKKMGEWCFLCGLPKYEACNDRTHNSH